MLLCGTLYGCLTHLRIYPVIYILGILNYLFVNYNSRDIGERVVDDGMSSDYYDRYKDNEKNSDKDIIDNDEYHDNDNDNNKNQNGKYNDNKNNVNYENDNDNKEESKRTGDFTHLNKRFDFESKNKNNSKNINMNNDEGENYIEKNRKNETNRIHLKHQNENGNENETEKLLSMNIHERKNSKNGFSYNTKNSTNVSVYNQNTPTVKHHIIIEKIKNIFIFVASSSMSFFLFSGVSYLACGWNYFEHAILYHLTRADHRHNFSPLFYGKSVYNISVY